MVPTRSYLRLPCLFLFLTYFLLSAEAGTFYIDYATGADNNNGTSKSTPWQRHPYMRGFSGTYTHQIGDRFIHKGGVTWPNSCFPINTFGNGGANGTYDYYGVDQSWYSGTSWTRPKWDAQGQEMPNGYDVMVLLGIAGRSQSSYVTFDNIEFRGIYWNGPKNDGWVNYILLQESLFIHIENCRFCDWSYGPLSSGTNDSLTCIKGNTASPYSTGCYAKNCEFDGGATGKSSGCAVYVIPVAMDCKVKNVSNGIIGASVYAGNDVSEINLSFAGSGVHTNALEALGSCWLINNRVYGNIHGEPFLNQGPGNYYYFNNVFWLPITGKPCLEWDSLWGSGGNHYAYGNTLVTSNYGMGGPTRTPAATNKLGTVVIQNNLIISPNGIYNPGNGQISLVQDHNVLFSPAQASSLGYTSSNLYLSPSNPGSGIGYSSVVNSLPDTINGVDVRSIKDRALKDINGNTRTQWTIGAYEFGGTAPPPTPTPVPTATPSGTPTPTPTATPTPSPTATPTITPTPPTILGLLFDSTAGLISPPFAANADNTISQAFQTVDPTQGGSAVYNFNVPTAGDYVVSANVNAPDTAANSFFVDIDSQPLAPLAIWDVPTTSGFERRVVSWRGNGTDADNQFETKVFTLSEGVHQLIIRGRESGTKLGQITIGKLPAPPGNLRPVVGP